MSGVTIAANILKPLETSSSIGMFARDTGGCLISKLALSRSKDESREISIAELAESSVFYFSAPMLAKTNANIFSKIMKTDKNLLTSPLENIKRNKFVIPNTKKSKFVIPHIKKNQIVIPNSFRDLPVSGYLNEFGITMKTKTLKQFQGDSLYKQTLKNVKLGKFGQIASVFSIILPAVFAIAPVRNFITLGKTGKEKFVNVVELDKTKQKEQKEKAKEKTKNLCKTLGITALSGLGITALILAMSKNDKFYKKAEPFIDKTIKHFEFTKSGDLELKHYGALIYPVSIASYFYASRDKYEKQENARRFAVTVPLMFYGEKLIQNPIHKIVDKKFGTNIFNNGNIKTYDEIMKMAEPVRRQSLKAKNLAYGAVFLINTMAIAAGVALLNRYETRRKYETEHKTNNIQYIQTEEKPIWEAMKI